MEPRRVPCAGAIVHDPAGRLLMIRRGTEPDRGRWSLPGGRLEPGETHAEAVVREVLEETGLAVVVGDLVGEVELPVPGGAVAVVRDFRCTPARGADLAAVQAGDDAAEVGWFAAGELHGLDCSAGLVATLVDWGVLGTIDT